MTETKQEILLRWVKVCERNPPKEWYGPIRYRYDEKYNTWEYDAGASRAIQCNLENYPDVEWLEEISVPVKSEDEDYREVIAIVARDNNVSRLMAELKSKYSISRKQ